MAPTTDPVLDFSTVRPSIKIDGDEYQLKKPGDFSILAYQKRTEDYGRIGKILTSKKQTDADLAAAHRMAESLCLTIIEAPADVQAKLDDLQRMEIINHFFQQLNRRMGSRNGFRQRKK